MSDDSQNTGYTVASIKDGRKVTLFEDGTWMPNISGGEGDDTGGTGGDGGDNHGAAGGTGTGSANKASSDGGSNTGGSDDGKAKDKVIFTAEQQSVVEKIVDQAHVRAKASATKEAAAMIDALKAEIADANEKASASASKKNTDQSDATAKQIAEMNEKHKDELAARDVQIKRAADSNKQAKIYAAISKHDVMDIADVAKLVSGNIALDENEVPIILDETGNTRIDVNENGAPMTIETFMGEWLNERPHFLKSSNAGAGSRSQKFGDGTVEIDWTNIEAIRSMPLDELKAKLNEGLVVHGSNGQKFQFKGEVNPFTELRKTAFAK